MKKPLLISLAITILLIPASFIATSSDNIVSIAHAQSGIQKAAATPGVDTTQVRAPGNPIGNAAATPGIDTTQTPAGGTSGIANAAANPGFDATQSPTSKEANPKTQCTGGFFDGIYCALVSILQYLAFVPIAITGLLVYFSGLLLNITLFETVFNLGTNLQNMGGIAVAWTALRDLANILLIFGLLAIAIGIIIGNSTYGNKKLIATLVIVALVINFSLFFTKFIIDTSNIVAVQFYRAISGEHISQDGSVGVSGAFMNQLGLAEAYNTLPLLDTLKKVGISKESGGGIGVMFGFSLMISIFFSITAFVFLFAAILLITRMVMFIILMILSPLAFAAMAIPSMAKMANEWWEKLLKYAMFAPMLLILFWVTITIMPDVQRAIGGSVGKISNMFASDNTLRIDGIRMALNFLIMSGFMYASIIISNRLSLDFGGVAKNITKWTSRKAGNYSLGAIAAIGRGTIGRGAEKFAGTKFAQRLELRSPRLAGAVVRGAQTLSKSNLDVRGVLGKDAQSFVGTPQTGGYVETRRIVAERRQKQSDRIAGTLGGSDPLRQARYRKRYAQKLRSMASSGSFGNVFSPTIHDANLKAAKNSEATGDVTRAEVRLKETTRKISETNKNLSLARNQLRGMQPTNTAFGAVKTQIDNLEIEKTRLEQEKNSLQETKDKANKVKDEFKKEQK
jgi:hypothetical protein